MSCKCTANPIDLAPLMDILKPYRQNPKGALIPVLLLLTALLSPMCANRANAYWSRSDSDARFGNRIQRELLRTNHAKVLYDTSHLNVINSGDRPYVRWELTESC